MARAAVDGPKGPYNVDKGTTIQEVTTGIAFTRDGRNFKVPWSQVALIETETPVRRKVRRDAREGADE